MSCLWTSEVGSVDSEQQNYRTIDLDETSNGFGRKQREIACRGGRGPSGRTEHGVEIMEAFGILIALLIGLVGAPVFCFVLTRFVRPIPAVASFGFWAAAPIVALFAIDILLIIAFGVLGTRALVGPGFFLTQAVLSLAIGPALACVLLLGPWSISRWWPLVAAICWIVGAAGIFHRYNVADTLYGIDGFGGPYQWPW